MQLLRLAAVSLLKESLRSVGGREYGEKDGEKGSNGVARGRAVDETVMVKLKRSRRYNNNDNTVKFVTTTRTVPDC